MYKVIVPHKVSRAIKKLDTRYQPRIYRAILSLKNSPQSKGKPLVGSLKGIYSLRIGIYRILYHINGQLVTVTILQVGHRKDIYQKA
jgi:mRNA interferase RelE/StbE